jgi:hypothetical protein
MVSIKICVYCRQCPEFHYGYGSKTLDAVTYNFLTGAELNFMIIATTSGCIPVVVIAYRNVGECIPAVSFQTRNYQMD